MAKEWYEKAWDTITDTLGDAKDTVVEAKDTIVDTYDDNVHPVPPVPPKAVKALRSKSYTHGRGPMEKAKLYKFLYVEYQKLALETQSRILPVNTDLERLKRLRITGGKRLKREKMKIRELKASISRTRSVHSRHKTSDELDSKYGAFYRNRRRKRGHVVVEHTEDYDAKKTDPITGDSLSKIAKNIKIANNSVGKTRMKLNNAYFSPDAVRQMRVLYPGMSLAVDYALSGGKNKKKRGVGMAIDDAISLLESTFDVLEERASDYEDLADDAEVNLDKTCENGKIKIDKSTLKL